MNCARNCISLPPLWDPPAREVLGASPTGSLSIVTGSQGLRLLLAVTGEVTADVMVFGQAPCSVGRHKRRNVAYLGLLPLAENGWSDITDIYVAKYGPLTPHTKIFIVTRLQKNGWEGPMRETSEIVPAAPEGQQAASSRKPECQQTSTEAVLPLEPLMYTGCTGDAQGISQTVVPCSQEGGEAEGQARKASKSALGEGGEGGGPGFEGVTKVKRAK